MENIEDPIKKYNTYIQIIKEKKEYKTIIVME